MDADSPAPTPEKPVFAATGEGRPRALKLVGRAAAGLVGLWLVALVLGALGFGHVPGFQLPRIIGKDHPKTEDAKLVPKQATHTVQAAASPAVRATRQARIESRGTRRDDGRRSSAGGGNRSGTTRNGGSRGGGSNSGGNGSSGTTVTPDASTPAVTPATTPTPTPAATTAPGNSGAHSNSTHSNSTATPPGSSSAAPGSRSQSTTAPGHTGTTPTPGRGQGNGNGNNPAG